jgi:hypothetical protein
LRMGNPVGQFDPLRKKTLAYGRNDSNIVS